MALTKEDKQLIREMLMDTMTGVHARTEAQFTIIDNKLDGINTHLSKLNSKVASHEKRLNESDTIHAVEKANEENNDKNRAQNCPHLSRLESLETSRRIKIGIKEFLIGTLSIAIMVLTITYTTMKIQDREFERKQEVLIEQLKKELNDE